MLSHHNDGQTRLYLAKCSAVNYLFAQACFIGSFFGLALMARFYCPKSELAAGANPSGINYE